jgi:FixJ family two-component response regulator
MVFSVHARFPDAGLRRRAMAAGAVGFLHKPFNGKALIQFIQDAISQGGGKA